MVEWGTTWIQMPIETSFDPRSPDDIEQAYKDITTTKISRFKKTLYASLFSAFMVSLSLVLMSMNSSNTNNEFIVKVEEINKKKIVAITTYVLDSNLATLKVFDSNKSLIKILKIIPTKKGLVQVNIPITQSKNYTVSIDWNNSKGIKTELSKEINNNKI